jgi:hypothetical protein
MGRLLPGARYAGSFSELSAADPPVGTRGEDARPAVA